MDFKNPLKKERHIIIKNQLKLTDQYYCLKFNKYWVIGINNLINLIQILLVFVLCYNKLYFNTIVVFISFVIAFCLFSCRNFDIEGQLTYNYWFLNKFMKIEDFFYIMVYLFIIIKIVFQIDEEHAITGLYILITLYIALIMILVCFRINKTRKINSALTKFY